MYLNIPPVVPGSVVVVEVVVVDFDDEAVTGVEVITVVVVSCWHRCGSRGRGCRR